MKNCNWCNKDFYTKISYQIYCSEECRDSATKEKIAQRYLQTRRKKRKGKIRLCKHCNEKLSVYNDDNLCVKCIINPKDVNKALKDIKGKINDSKK